MASAAVSALSPITSAFGTAFSSIGSKLGGFFSSLTGRASSGGSSVGQAFTGGFSAKVVAIGQILGNVFSAAMSMVSQSIGSAISRVDTLNQFPKVMQQMGFSAESSQASITRLSDGIKGLPTSLDSITSSTQSIALLTGDLDTATDTALALNDAFLASGSSTADAERGLTQYTQMLSRGTVDLESWRTLQETMGYALRETANAMGYTGDSAVNDLYSALQSGEVAFDEFNAKLVECDQAQGGFADTAATASAGIGTSMQNMQTAVTRNLANIIDAINGDGAISGAFDSMSAAIDTVGASITTAVGAAMPTLTSLASVALPMLSTGLQTLQAFLAPIITDVITLGANLMATLAPVLTSIGSMLSVAIPAALTALSAIWNAVWPALSSTVQTVFNIISPIVTTAMGVIEGIITTVMAVINGDWSGAWSGIQSIASTVWSGIQSVASAGISAVSGVVSSVLGTISSTWSSIWGSISGAFSGIWSGIKSGATTGINAVYTTVTGIKSKITGFFSGAASWLISSGKSIMSGLADGIKAGISTATSAISSAVETVRSWLPFSPAKVGPFSGHGYTTYSGKALMSGFAEGIANGASLPVRALDSALSKVGTDIDYSVGLNASRYGTGSRKQQGGGTTINQNVKVVRSDADLYSAATIINRSALRLAGA